MSNLTKFSNLNSRSFLDQLVSSIGFLTYYLTVFTRTNNMADYPTDYYDKLAQKLAVMKKEDNAQTDKKALNISKIMVVGAVPSANTVKQS